MGTILKTSTGSKKGNKMEIASLLRVRKCNSIMALILIGTVLALFMGCTHKPLTDGDLTKAFLANREAFRALSVSYAEGHVSCGNKNDPDICVMSGSESVISRLREDAHVQSAYVKRDRAGDNGLWLPVETYGAMSTSSSTRGYVYLDSSPVDTVPDTLSTDKKGSHYKLLEDHWYLFTVN
jgi:hypothetical protein